MGQGLYQAVVFGVIDKFTNAPWNQDGNFADWLSEAADPHGDSKDGVHFHTSYEAEPSFFGITLAVSDGALSDWWKVAELPDRVAFRLSDLSVEWQMIADKQVAKAKQVWKSLQETCKAKGFDLPDAELLYVSDWD
jgi:hypothetical protein